MSMETMDVILEQVYHKIYAADLRANFIGLC